MDHAIWRRIKVIPFEVTIPDAEQDKRLSEKLRKELCPACSRGRSKAASSGSATG
jgi:phage/plasmid-associated DNA primase